MIAAMIITSGLAGASALFARHRRWMRRQNRLNRIGYNRAIGLRGDGIGGWYDPRKMAAEAEQRRAA